MCQMRLLESGFGTEKTQPTQNLSFLPVHVKRFENDIEGLRK